MTRVAVYAPTPTGGHPEYVAALLEAMAQVRPNATFLWPVRSDAAPRPEQLDAVRRPRALPVMPDWSALPRAARVRRRLQLTDRHDVAFLRWLWRQRRSVDWVLLEEYEQLTLPLLVWGVRAMRVRVAVHVHNVTPHGYRGSRGQRLALAVGRLGLSGARVVAVHARSNAAALRRLLHLRATPAVIGHGIRVRRTQNPAAEGPPRFLAFGAYRPNKGLDVLVEALRLLPDAELVVAGPVPEADLPAVAKLLRPLGERVRWEPRLLPDEDLLALFDGVTAAVLPYRDFEAQSGVLHLAVEMAVPVVVSDVGGLAEVTEDLGIGEVLPELSAPALAAALRRVAEPECNAELRRRVTAGQARLSWTASAGRLWGALEAAAR